MVPTAPRNYHPGFFPARRDFSSFKIGESPTDKVVGKGKKTSSRAPIPTKAAGRPENEEEAPCMQLSNGRKNGGQSMTKVKEIYKCEACGNVVEVQEPGDGELVCCGEPMKKQ